MNSDRYSYRTVNANTLIKNGAGVLHAIVPTNTTGSMTVYDNGQGASGSILWGPSTFAAGNPQTILFDTNFTQGIFVSFSGGTGPITFVYK